MAVTGMVWQRRPRRPGVQWSRLLGPLDLDRDSESVRVRVAAGDSESLAQSRSESLRRNLARVDGRARAALIDGRRGARPPGGPATRRAGDSELCHSVTQCRAAA
jgi:hypothetical protein